MPVTKIPLPPWLRIKPPGGENYVRIKGLLGRHGLNTVCEEASCPNVSECWGGGTATFMIMGNACTRGCRFCSVASAARPGALDLGEPRHLAEALAALNLKYAVITTVCRDDLADQGAAHIAECIREVRERIPGMILEILTGDFQGDSELLKAVVQAGPHVLCHNLETVERLTPHVRDRRAGYHQSLEVLRQAKALRPQAPTKSSLMVGLGETQAEIQDAFRDLRAVGVEIVTLGQYLRPSSGGRNLPVIEYVSPEKFQEMEQTAKGFGFLYVASGPFVRSSYRAAELYFEGRDRKAVRQFSGSAVK